VTCGDGRGWTCCRQMACKRSGVRISLAPPRSEAKFEQIEQKDTAGSTATAARWVAVCVFGLVSSVASAASTTADFCHRSGAFRPATWAISRSPGSVTFAAWSSPGWCERSAGR
jgi:hypothetical protein